MLREIRDWVEELACRAGFDGLPSLGRAGKPLAALACVGLVAWLLWGQAPVRAGGAAAATAPAAPASIAEKPASSAAPQAPATVTVHVVGEVRRPGVYELHDGARVRDAVKAAGGLLGDAEEAAVNLARVVVDGEQISVPRKGEAPAGDGAAGGAVVPGGKVDLNTATAAQLDTLPGVGPATAAKIISDRTANGPFRSVEDLMRVPGIGPAKFEALKDLVSAG